MHANEAAMSAIKDSLRIVRVIDLEELSDFLAIATDIESHDAGEMRLIEATFGNGSTIWASQHGSHAMIVHLNTVPTHLALAAPP